MYHPLKTVICMLVFKGVVSPTNEVKSSVARRLIVDASEMQDRTKTKYQTTRLICCFFKVFVFFSPKAP